MDIDLTQSTAREILKNPETVIASLQESGYQQDEIIAFLRLCNDVAAEPGEQNQQQIYDKTPDHLKSFKDGTDTNGDKRGRGIATICLTFGATMLIAVGFVLPKQSTSRLIGVGLSFLSGATGLAAESRYGKWKRYADIREESRIALAQLIQQAELESLMLPPSGSSPVPVESSPAPVGSSDVTYGEIEGDGLDGIIGGREFDGGRRAIAESRYPEMSEIATLGHKLITGGESSGKATSAITALSEVYDQGFGVVPFCYDPSEGGEHQTHSSWSRSGVPSTSDMWEFVEVLQNVSQNLGNRKLRNDPDYGAQPPIVILIDEIITSLERLKFEDSDTYKEVCLAIQEIVTRGTKVGVFLIIMGQSVQIQNLKSILNTGLISNLEVLALNRQIGQRVRDARIRDEDLPHNYHRYFQDKSGQYMAAIFKITDGIMAPTMIEHPTHSGEKPRPSCPPTRPIPVPRLAPIPHWFGGAARNHYEFFSKLQTGEMEMQIEDTTDLNDKELKLKRATEADIQRGKTRSDIISSWISCGDMSDTEAEQLWNYLQLAE